MRSRCFVVGLGVGAISLLHASLALGGSYTVNACVDDARGANLSWASASSDIDLPSYNAGCTGAAADGLIARAAAKPGGGLVPAFGATSWTFDAPPGTTIDRADLSLWLYRYGGGETDRWGVGVGDEGGAYLLGGIGQSALSTGSRGSYFALTVANRTALRLGVVCANGGGCSVAATNVAGARYSRASAELFGARVRISDPTTAVLSAQAGSLWTSSAWLSGSQSLSFVASDNVGIASAGADVGGQRRAVTSDCDFARTIPCPATRDFSATFDTMGLADGPHTLTIDATDSGGNQSSQSRQILVDNTAPAAPGAPQLSGSPASVWRTTNDFTLTYSNPVKTAGAPLSSHDVELCPVASDGKVATNGCGSESRPGAPAIDTISLPAVGRYKMRVRVNDELFKGEWGQWSAELRFDNSAAGTPVVSYPVGWVNRERALLPLRIDPPAASSPPPSGYASYRVTVDGGPPTTVAAAGKDESASFNLEALGEGRHVLAVTAVTGAGIVTESLLASSGVIEKDVVAPQLAVSGAPAHDAFVTTPVTLTLRGSDETSGMAAAVSPAPVASGGYIAVQLDHGSEQMTGGAFAQISPGEGQHIVQSYASDVAGNRSALQSISYTQDTKQPSGGLRPMRPETPALLEFFIDERCLGRASIELSTSPGIWRPLTTSEGLQRASATVPADIWEPRTPYTVRAVVSDCAGNSTELIDWYGGDRSGTPIGTITPPPRAVIGATAEIAAASSSKSASAAASRRVTAIVVDKSGDPLPGLLVRIETQPWMTPATWAPAGSVRTNEKGRASAVVSAHSSLRVRVVVPGDELRTEAVSNIVYATRLAATTIAASPRSVRAGRRTMIKGRLRGGYVPRAGFDLVLYGRGPRSRGWVPISTDIAVSSGGYWRAPYRFLRSSRGSFKFRVRTPNRPDYPFRSRTSQSVRVRVR
ncbi:MAG: hypothetical protein NWS55_02975 [Solirubrobacteraceae bacterium]|nr:hypothetical protein [Solirubrobacteraceae bacterium]